MNTPKAEFLRWAVRKAGPYLRPLSIGLFTSLAAFILFNPLPVFAASRFSVATGNWNSTATWSASSGGAPGASVPVAGDAVTIEGGFNVTLTANAACTSVTFTAITATSLSISTYQLDVSGAITIPRSGAGVNLIAVGGGTLNAGSIAFTSGGGPVRHQITISTGTVTVTGDITTDNAGASASITFTGAGTLNAGVGILTTTTAGGTLTTVAGSTINYNGSGAQVVKDVAYSGNLTLSGSGTKTWTLAGAETVGGILTVGAGAGLTTAGNQTLGITGATNVSGTLTLGGTSAKTFTGDVTINSGGVWNETGVAAYTIAGNFTNNATTFTSNTGIHTFSGAAKILSGATTTTIANTTISGTLTNNDKLTVNTALAGAGTLTNGSAGTLYYGGAGAIVPTLTATAVGNTVNYTDAAQVGKVTTYYNLTLSGTAAKTFATTPTVNGVLSLEGTASVVVTAGVVTYGGGATLQYNKGAAYTATAAEWITPFAATGGVMIVNTGAITLNTAKVFNLDVPLTINSGATLNTSAANNYQLTFGGNYINNGGTLTANASPIVITNTGTQSIAGYTTTGLTTMSKTGGTATFTGNVSGAGLTINGVGGTLNLGAGNTHTFTGDVTLTNGTLNGGTSTINENSASVTAWGGTGSNFVPSGGTVNFGAAGAQTISATGVSTFNNLNFSNSGAKTTPASVTVNGNWDVTGASAAMNTSNTSITVTGNISGSGNITSGSGTINVAGNWTNNGTFTCDSGTVNYTKSSGGQTVGGQTYNNLIFSNTSGIQSAGGAIVVNTAVTTTAGGTLDMVTYALSGAFTPAGGGTIMTQNTTATPIPAGKTWPGTIEYSLVGGGQTVVTSTYNNLKVDNTGGSTDTAGGALTVNGSLTTATGGTLDMSTYQLSGSLTPTNNGTIKTANTGGSPITLIGISWGGTIEYSATGGGQTIVHNTYNNLKLDNTGGTDTADGNLVVNGTLTVTAGGRLDMSTYTLGGTLGTISNGGTIKTSNTSAAPLTSGKTWSGTIEYAALGGLQTVATGTYDNLTLDNTSAIDTAGGNLTVNTAVTTTAGGILDMSTYTLGGTLITITNGGTIRTQNTSGAPIPTGKTWGGTVQYNAATGGQTVMAGTYNNLNISNTSGIQSASGALTVNTYATTTAGGTLNMVTYQMLGGFTPVNGGTIRTQNVSGTPIPTGKTWGGTVQYDATNGGQTVMTGTYNNLMLGNTTNEQTASGALTVNTYATTTAGGTLNMVTYQLLGGFTPVNGGTIRTQSVSGTPIPTGKTWGGTVQYDSTSGQTISNGTYTNLTASGGDRTLSFTAGQTYTVSGTWTSSGTSGHLLSLRSSSSGNQWNVDPQGTRTLSYLDVKDSNNTNVTAVLLGTESVNSGNNTNWSFTNPAPSQTSISPSSVEAGGSSFSLTSDGSSFVASSTVYLDGNALVTHFVNSSQVTSTVPSSYIAVSSTHSITVFNPTPGGGTSTAQTLHVIDTTPPTVTITAPTHTSNATITDTQIHVVNTLIHAANVIVATSTTLTYDTYSCVQTVPFTTVDCTIHILSSGTLVIKATDDSYNFNTQSEGGYVITDPAIAAVAADKAALVDNDIKGANPDLSHVTVHLTNPLPSIGSASGSAITWFSSVTSTVSGNGQAINRPIYSAGDAAVNMTAWIASSTASDSKVFNLTVLKLPASTDAKVTSVAYTVSGGNGPAETITDVPFATASSTFLSNLTKSESHSTWDITHIHNPVVSTDYLTVTAEDGGTVITYTVTTLPAPAVLAVAADKAALVDNNIKGANADLSHITVHLTNPLPSIGSASGSAITWFSDASSTVSGDGQTINRPIFSAGDAAVNMTAWIASSTASDSKVFALTVLKLPASTDAKVTSVTYTVSGGSGPAETITNVPFATASSTFLANLTKHEAHSTWNINGIHNPVLTGDTLVVTAEDGSTVITYTVTTLPDPAIAAVAADKAALVDNDIKGANPDLSHVTVHLTNPLPSIGSASGSAITWFSSVTSTVSGNGQTINRPIFSAGDAAVNMTAWIASSTASDSKVFNLTVLKLPASTDAKVTSVTYTVSGGSGPAETITNVPFATASSTFLANLTKHEAHSTWNINGIHNPVVTGDTLVVTAEDGVTSITYTVTVNSDQAAQAVAADKAALVDNNIKGANPDLSNITVHLTNPLPSLGSASGSAITWFSSVTSTVSGDGQTINRPIFSAGDAAVNMTAWIASSTASDSKVFALTVLKLPASTDAKVTSVTYTVSGGSGPAETITNVPFATASSTFLANLTKHEAHSIWNINGIHNPVLTGDTLVVTAEDGSTVITYTVTVGVNPATQAVAADKAALVDNDIKGANADLSHITVHLTNPLPSIGSASGSAITWFSSVTSTVSGDGQTINRPIFSAGDAAVNMTAWIASSTASDSKVFTLTVLKLPASTDAKVTSGSYTVSGGSGPAETIINVPLTTASSTFLANLTKHEAHSTWNINGIHNPVLTGDTLVVTAEDGATSITYTVTVNLDVTPPVLSSISATPGSSNATIAWTTDELASSKVIYSQNTSYASSTLETDTAPRVLSHSVSLSSLNSCSLYHYKVVSRDAALNSATSTDQTFTTTGCAGNATVLSSSEGDMATSTGGTLTLLSGGTGMTLNIPAGYSSDTATFQINQLDKAMALGTLGSPSGFQAVGNYVYQLNALVDPSTGLTTFSGVITVTINYTGGDLTGVNESSLWIYRYSGGVWSPLTGCVINTVAKTVTCTTTNFSTFSLFGTAAVAAGGGGGGPVYAQPAAGQASLSLALDHVERLDNGLARIWLVWVHLNAQPSTVRGYALSTDPSLAGASINNYTDLVSITVPGTSDKVTLYGRYYSTTGEPSPLLTLVVDLTTAPGAAPATVAPGNLGELVSGVQSKFGKTCDQSLADLVANQVTADAKEFKLVLTPDQATAVRNFILCGNSQTTINYGMGERRAIMRDYMETVHYSAVVWSDIERIANGQIPLTRNIAIERAQVTTAQPVFRRLFGHDPNFKDATENLAWNSLLYRIRFPRDLVKEAKGIKSYYAIYGHNPVRPFSWAVVRVLGYVKK